MIEGELAERAGEMPRKWLEGGLCDSFERLMLYDFKRSDDWSADRWRDRFWVSGEDAEDRHEDREV